MTSNRYIPSDVADSILTSTRRRCALCFGLSGDLSEKKGQIAHLDHDPSNNDVDNLAFLCLEHHDEYDSKTSQSKGLTKKEVTVYRSLLYRAVETGLNPALSETSSRSSDVIDHDRNIFSASNEILQESHLNAFLDILQTDDAYTDSGRKPVRSFCYFFEEVGNHFVNPEIAGTTSRLVISLKKLLGFLSQHFFVYPANTVETKDWQYAMYPEFNIDRAGVGTPEQMARYSEFQEQLDEHCSTARESYKTYRKTIKYVLLR